jgi:hypothetical protein
MFSNNGLFDGSTGAIPRDTLAMSGLDQQIRNGDTDYKSQAVAFSGFGGASSVIRNQGDAILTEEDMEEGAVSILTSFGVPTELHLEPMALSKLSRTFFIKERIHPMGVVNGQAGFVLRDFISSAGTFALRPNVFLRPKSEYYLLPSSRLSPAQPALPVITNGGVNIGSGFVAGQTYFYKVGAINDQGESIASPSSLVGTVAITGESLIATFANVVGAKYYAIYRTDSGGAIGTERFIGYISAALGVNTVFIDLNRKLPGRSSAYLMFLDPESLVFRQLSPLSKINLATVAAAFEWLQVLYGCLIIFTPRKHFVYENVAR